MSPSQNESTTLASTGEKGAPSPRFCFTVQRTGKKLTRGKQISKDQATKLRKLRLQSLQKIKKRRADQTMTRMLNKLSMNSTIEKKRKGSIKQRSEKLMEVTSEVDVDLKQENAANEDMRSRKGVGGDFHKVPAQRAGVGS